jgi:hypothetical protein
MTIQLIPCKRHHDLITQIDPMKTQKLNLSATNSESVSNNFATSYGQPTAKSFAGE